MTVKAGVATHYDCVVGATLDFHLVLIQCSLFRLLAISPKH